MKKIIIASLVALTIIACSAAQKSAEQQLGLDIGSCAVRVALSDLNRSPAVMLKDVAATCGEQAVTNPTDIQHLIDSFTNAQSAAVKAGAKLTFAPDAGAQ